MTESLREQITKESSEAMQAYLNAGNSNTELIFTAILTLAKTLHEAGCIDIRDFAKNFINDLKE